MPIYHEMLTSQIEAIGMINYMAKSWTRINRVTDAMFVGFIPITGTFNNWGTEIGGVPCAAVHVMKCTDLFGDDENETAELVADKPWMLLFYGSDNASYFMRFTSRDNAFEFLNENASVQWDADGMMYYNS